MLQEIEILPVWAVPVSIQSDPLAWEGTFRLLPCPNNKSMLITTQSCDFNLNIRDHRGEGTTAQRRGQGPQAAPA